MARKAQQVSTPPLAVPITAEIDHVLPEVVEMLPKWQRIRDCINGSDAMRKRAATYLPHPFGLSVDKTEAAVFSTYANRAIYNNATGRTISGMVGQVFAKAPSITLPASMEPYLLDIDGGTVQLEQQVKQALHDVLGPGRCGILADYPTDRPLTRKEITDGGIHPTIQYYFAEQIINWRIDVIDGMRKVTLVVLAEEYTAKDDGFKKEVGEQWRVLRLVDNVYTMAVYRKQDGSFIESTAEFAPTDAAGATFNEIPFYIIGPQNNDPGIDDPPVMALAEINLGHFRNSADFEDLLFLIAQPTPVFTGLTQAWVDENMSGKVVLGSRIAQLLPKGATAELLQVNESQLLLAAMEHKERQMVALGAKLVESNKVQRTLGEARIEVASEASVLSTATQNVSAAYTRALKVVARFAGATGDVEYALNTDFEISSLTPEARGQLLKEWQAGSISFTEYRDLLRRAGIATQSDEEAKEEIDNDTERTSSLIGGIDPATGMPLPALPAVLPTDAEDE